MTATFWALIPPIIAIALALLTKQVYISLLVGIISGALFYTNFDIMGSLETTLKIISQKMGENTNILIFLVLLGTLVALMNRSGASSAYGKWASQSIKSKRGASFATMGLGSLIFVDDYFNCLTVGTVMAPVTDRFKISRAKLAYLIDATAAPVCIIAPVSSWAAAVGSSLPSDSGIDGFDLFLRTIPFNLYALLTLVMMIILIALNFDFSKMKKNDTTSSSAPENNSPIKNQNGKVFDLIIPIIVLIVLCILAMLYTGGMFSEKSISEAFANCDSSLSLVIGSFFTLIIVFFLYIPRKIVSFTEFCDSLTDGFKAMVPAILILTFAWTLSGICSEDYLNAGGFVQQLVGSHEMAQSFMPPIFFLIALGLAFATGTSWGTFGILIPIATSVFGTIENQLLVITVAAILAGAVCGDHISPISDTTILSSTGAGCDHLIHVSTQIPYALIVASCCFIGYIAAGLTVNGWLGLSIGLILLLLIMFVIYRFSTKHSITQQKT